ncbi:D-arabinono-1,4-lactone oxidase [Geodermatophilus normandii]|uniref:FAD-binding protein n=1 Tax=Geodermatophilus normandii TaxID=1137989 RepID=A0A6P0GGI0_9ACTN|nr:FAD-binding protein [Geodermatophilus normandii]
MAGTWRNWAGDQRAAGLTVVAPAGTEAIAAEVRAAAAAGRRVTALGSGHSFNGIGRPEDVAVALHRHAGLAGVDDDGLVTVQAGMPLHRLNAELAVRGWALTNLGDVDRQTVAGALSTGTHGTGARFGGLATQLRALELVLADGTVLHCSPGEHPDVFSAARIGLGALGVLSTVTLQAVPAFALRAEEGPARLPDLLEAFDEVMTATDHVEFYWFPHTDRCLTKRNTRVPLEQVAPLGRARAFWDDEVLANAGFAAVVAAGRRVPALVPPLARFSAGALGARTYTDVAHRVFVSRRRVRFREMEYAVPREAAPEVLAELRRVVDAGPERVPFPVEVRAAAADDVPLSTASGRDTAYVAVHVPARDPSGGWFAAFEAIAGAAGGRPHWGKLHGLDAAALAGRYPRFGEFTALRERLDPAGVFANAHLDRVLGRTGDDPRRRAPAGPARDAGAVAP